MREFEVVERNLSHALCCFARAAPEGGIDRLPGVLLANAAVACPVFNAALLEGRVTVGGELERRVAAARFYYEARGLRWSFWLCHDLLPPALRGGLGEVFSRHGLGMAARCPGMTAAALPLSPGREVPGLSFRPVQDEETRTAFCRITAACFRVPLKTSTTIYAHPQAWRDGLEGWIGFLRGRPVASAATIVAAGAIGLYSVATLPEHQRRGIGEQITRHALAAAREQTGLERMVLQSTPQGVSLYRRLGFRDVARFTVFASE